MTNPSATRDSELVARQERLATLRATPAKPIEPRRKAIAYEISSFLGEVPHAVDSGGVERWETYLPLADTIDRLTSTGAVKDAFVEGYICGVGEVDSATEEKLIEQDAHALWEHSQAKASAVSPREGHVEVPLFSKEAIEDFQFLAQMQVGLRDCIGLDREKLTIAKRLRDRGYVTIADSAQGPMVELTEAGAVKALERFEAKP